MDDNTKCQFYYKGSWYDFDSEDFKQVLLSEGLKKENEGTLLGIIAEVVKNDENSKRQKQ